MPVSVGFSLSCAYTGVTCALSLHILQVYTLLWVEAVGGAPDPGCSREQGRGHGQGQGWGPVMGAGGWESRSELFCPPWRLGAPAA